MNEHLRSRTLPGTSNEAEGLLRRRFSVAEIEAMVEAGVIDADERFELIGGEIVPMSPKGYRHEVIKSSLMLHWAEHRPKHLRITQETTFRLSEDTFVEPDFVFYTRDTGLKGLTPATCLLAVEVADTSLTWDTGRKAQIYAAFGIAELWVINARDLTTLIHRKPAPEGYGDIRPVAADEPLRMSFAPELDVALDTLDLV
jgi:Uma2 family endonuclease